MLFNKTGYSYTRKVSGYGDVNCVGLKSGSGRVRSLLGCWLGLNRKIQPNHTSTAQQNISCTWNFWHRFTVSRFGLKVKQQESLYWKLMKMEMIGWGSVTFLYHDATLTCDIWVLSPFVLPAQFTITFQIKHRWQQIWMFLGEDKHKKHGRHTCPPKAGGRVLTFAFVYY